MRGKNTCTPRPLKTGAFPFFLFLFFTNLSSCNVSSIWSFPLNFSPPFFKPITLHWNFPESNTKMGGGFIVSSSSTLFFSCLFLIKRKRMVVVHEKSSVKQNKVFKVIQIQSDCFSMLAVMLIWIRTERCGLSSNHRQDRGPFRLWFSCAHQCRIDPNERLPIHQLTLTTFL